MLPAGLLPAQNHLGRLALAGDSYDNCSVWSFTPVSKSYTTANIGVNNLTINVKDFSGNAAMCVSQVTVLPYGVPGRHARTIAFTCSTIKIVGRFMICSHPVFYGWLFYFGRNQLTTINFFITILFSLINAIK